ARDPRHRWTAHENGHTSFGHTVQEKDLPVGKQRVGRYSKEFRRMAVERLKTCDNIVALSKELGVHRRLLYKWRDQFAPFDETAEPATGSSPQATLRRKVHQ